MNKTILIATDFSLESLETLKKVLHEKHSQNDENSYHILLLSGYDMGDSIRDLLFTTKSHVFEKIRSQEFCDAYSIIQNKYPKLIRKISCDIFTGNFQRTFNQYIEVLNIEETYYPSSSLNQLKKGQFNIIPYIKKCKHLRAEVIETKSPQMVPEKGRLAEIFL